MKLCEITYRKDTNIWEIDESMTQEDLVKIGEMTHAIYESEDEVWTIIPKYPSVAAAFYIGHLEISKYMEEKRYE